MYIYEKNYKFAFIQLHCKLTLTSQNIIKIKIILNIDWLMDGFIDG